MADCDTPSLIGRFSTSVRRPSKAASSEASPSIWPFKGSKLAESASICPDSGARSAGLMAAILSRKAPISPA